MTTIIDHIRKYGYCLRVIIKGSEGSTEYAIEGRDLEKVYLRQVDGNPLDNPPLIPFTARSVDTLRKMGTASLINDLTGKELV